MMYVIFLLISFTNQILGMHQPAKIITSYQSLKAHAQHLSNADDTLLSTYTISQNAMPECVLNVFLNNNTTITQDMFTKFSHLTQEEYQALTLDLLKREIKKNTLESNNSLQNINQNLCKELIQSIDTLEKKTLEQKQRLQNWHYGNSTLFILFLVLLTTTITLMHTPTGCA